MGKKILFLSSRLPYPPIGGDRFKNYWLLNILSKHFKVHLVSITDGEVSEKFCSWMNSLNITYKIFRKSKIIFYINTLKSLLNSLPLQVNYYFFSDFKRYIDSIYKDFDLIFTTLIRTARYVMDIDKPKILDMADSIGLNYQRSAKRTSSLFWKLIYSVESKRLLDFEKKCILHFDKTLFFNQDERNFFNMPERTEWIPHGVNESLLSYERTDSKYRNCVAFFGKMDYQPNIDAVVWFVKNVMPIIDKKLRFIVVGVYPSKEVVNLARKYENVEVTGYVEDPYLILKSSLCVVAPMQTGGGIQNKVLESMALGTINIISSLAARPIGAEHGKHYFVLDDPKEIASLINDIYEHPEKYEYVKLNAREFIKNNFTWKIYESKLMHVISEVLEKSRH